VLCIQQTTSIVSGWLVSLVTAAPGALPVPLAQLRAGEDTAAAVAAVLYICMLALVFSC
jgi:hypothetical protein